MTRCPRKVLLWLVIINLVVSVPVAPAQAALPASGSANPDAQQELVAYIHNAWQSLTRSMSDCSSLNDPKLKTQPVLYAPFDFQVPADDLRRIQTCKITLQKLPKPITHMGDLKPEDVPRHGLLFLPYPYVVPGGRFNEMYGWDSYFILRGLLRDNEVGLARAMTDNFVYEISHYGMILNANRTYFLTRSQPPFLTEMILGVYERTRDRRWLRSTLPAIDRYYAFWTSPPHLVEATGLSRYFDLGDGPAPEVVAAERDAQGLTHYDRVREFFRAHDVPDYDVSQFYD